MKDLGKGVKKAVVGLVRGNTGAKNRSSLHNTLTKSLLTGGHPTQGAAQASKDKGCSRSARVTQA